MILLVACLPKLLCQLTIFALISKVKTSVGNSFRLSKTHDPKERLAVSVKMVENVMAKQPEERAWGSKKEAEVATKV